MPTRRLDEANGKTRLSRGQKRALETVSATQNEKHLQSVVSNVGANILQNLRNLASSLENVLNSPVKTFLGEVAKALGARRYGSNSEYATFERDSERRRERESLNRDIDEATAFVSGFKPGEAVGEKESDEVATQSQQTGRTDVADSAERDAEYTRLVDIVE